jgi:hypothetical protein
LTAAFRAGLKNIFILRTLPCPYQYTHTYIIRYKRLYKAENFKTFL